MKWVWIFVGGLIIGTFPTALYYEKQLDNERSITASSVAAQFDSDTIDCSNKLTDFRRKSVKFGYDVGYVDGLHVEADAICSQLKLKGYGCKVAEQQPAQNTLNSEY